MSFWIIVTGLSLAVSAILALALLRGGAVTAAAGQSAAAYDLKVYRDQLKEVDRDLARGVISAEHGERARAEISRRILAADAQMQGATAGDGQPKGVAVIMAVVAAVFLVGGALLIYRDMGAPGYGDQGLQARLDQAEATRANRPSQSAAEAMQPAPPSVEITEEFAQLMDQLRSAVEDRPDEVQGYRLLARNEARLGNFTAAYQAQAALVDLLGAEVSAGDLTDLADMMIIAAGGYISPEAEAALLQALAVDPSSGVARYYMGLMFAQVGRPDVAFRTWEALLDEGPANAAWIPPVRAQIADVAQMAGIPFSLPEAPAGSQAATTATTMPGPDAAAVEAAQEMSEEDRAEMIRGMVAGLADRLATEGGSAEEWARLMSAYGVLGELAQAQVIYEEALQVFAASPEALALIRAGAENAGLLQ